MYGVPANLDLSRFKNSTLVELGVGQFQMAFIFDPSVDILVQGLWQLHDSTGILIDEGAGDKSASERDPIRLHAIIGKEVTSSSVNAPASFSLYFDSGHVLTVFDNSSHYESFSIGDLYI
jgi:hypothetical protein